MSGTSTGRWLLIAAGMVVAITVVAAIMVMGTPGAQRQLRQDERRVRDLDSLRDDVEAWAKQRGELPPDLATLERRPGVRLRVTDPFTGEPYRYEPIDARRYRLCATFQTDTAQLRDNAWIDKAWRHPSGPYCFELTRKREQAAKVE